MVNPLLTCFPKGFVWSVQFGTHLPRKDWNLALRSEELPKMENVRTDDIQATGDLNKLNEIT
jgi:hypothetical protein